MIDEILIETSELNENKEVIFVIDNELRYAINNDINFSKDNNPLYEKTKNDWKNHFIYMETNNPDIYNYLYTEYIGPYIKLPKLTEDSNCYIKSLALIKSFNIINISNIDRLYDSLIRDLQYLDYENIIYNNLNEFRNMAQLKKQQKNYKFGEYLYSIGHLKLSGYLLFNLIKNKLVISIVTILNNT